MEITQQSREDRLELQLNGRFDANWADHVASAIETAIRAGQHHIDLDLSQVNYISSAGIRILVKYFKQLDSVHGALRVVRPTDLVRSTLQISGLGPKLVAATPTPEHAVASGLPGAEQPRPVPVRKEPERWERNGVTFESHDLPGAHALDCRVHGRPEKFSLGQLSDTDSKRVRFDSDVFGLGLGAFGTGSEDARGRFGEFLAGAGVAVTQPTDGSSVPDFQVTEGQLVPEVNLLYGLTAKGGFARLLRFEAGQSERRVIALSDLVEAALGNLQTAAAGFVILAESAGVVGATLRQSPVLAASQSPWSFPGVRDLLSFTTERNDERNVVFIVGFAEREPASDIAAFLRPVGPGTSAQGHFHAAVFPYRPLPRGNPGLRDSVSNLLASESAQSVMHLLADEREFEGVGQTDLMRGACWVGPLKTPGSAASP
jgi:anti-anti-sigma factor